MLSLYDPSDYLAYSTVNQWFSRQLAAGERPIASPSDDSLLVQPCDARAMVFPSLPADSRVWIKDSSFSVEELIGSEAYDAARDSPTSPSRFLDGSMALLRLAPQDYHRYHSPVAGTVVSFSSLSGGFQSVNSDGMTSANKAIFNQRTVMLLDTSGYANIGLVAYVSIGALCVGSVTFTPAVGSTVTKGQDVGFFQFGGSTVALVFEQGRVQFEQDLLEHSQDIVETLVQVGARLATAIV